MPSKQVSQLPQQPPGHQPEASLMQQYNSYQEYEDYLNTKNQNSGGAELDNQNYENQVHKAMNSS